MNKSKNSDIDHSKNLQYFKLIDNENNDEWAINETFANISKTSNIACKICKAFFFSTTLCTDIFASINVRKFLI